MAQNSSRSTADVILIVCFGLLAVVGCVCSLFSMVWAAAEPDEGLFVLAALFLGLVLAGVGSMGMVLLRQRYHMGWPLLVVGILLWSMGVVIFSFGLAAIFLYDEPTEFMSNLGFSVGLCMMPGAFLAMIGLFVFGYEARRETAVSPDEDADEWLKSVKADEKSRLDDENF